MVDQKFTTAIEARAIIAVLTDQAKHLSYNRDIWKLIENLDKLAKILSQDEVKARQTRNDRPAVEARQNLAKAIDYVEKMLLILRLTE